MHSNAGCCMSQVLPSTETGDSSNCRLHAPQEDEPATTSREGSNRGKRQHKSSLDASGRGFKSTVAVPVAQEPVLQSAGYGTTGGVQVREQSLA